MKQSRMFPIPSAQPSPPRPPDCANPRTTPPPECDLEDRGNIDDDDDVDVFNTSQELPVEGDDQRRLVQFRERWIEISIDSIDIFVLLFDYER